MEDKDLQVIMMGYQKGIPENKKVMFKNALKKASPEQVDNLTMVKLFNPVVTLILSIFLGGLGVDRFYIGDIGLGVAKLLVGWLTFGIWPLVDIFCSYRKAKEKNLVNLLTAL